MSSTVAGVLRRLGLLLSGVLVLALAVGVVAFAQLRPPSAPASVEIEAQRVSAGATSWVCAPAPTLPTATEGNDLDYDTDLGTGGGQVSTVVELTAIGDGEAPEMAVGPLGEQGVVSGTAGDLASTTVPEVTTPQVGVVEPTATGVPLVGGVTIARADGGDLRGLSVTPCQQPVTSAVVVGGSTELGSSSRLVLTNPGDTAATVTMSGWGATGPLPQIAPVVVPAGGVRSILLETISLEPRLAVRIDVEGGRVVPTLQDSALDGLIAAGTQIVGAAADPSTTLTVAGVPLSDGDTGAASLRLVNPNDEAATVTVEMLGQDGAAVLDGAVDSVVEAGTVVDISLAGVPAGQYGVRVTSDLPVAGAVRLTRTGTAGEADPDTAPVDIAWLPASAPVDRGVLPIPTELVDAVEVFVTNPGEMTGEVSATTYDATGAVIGEDTLGVGAGATVRLPLADGATLVVLEGEGFIASEVVTAAAADGTLIAAVPIVPDPFTEQSVAVHVQG